MIERVEETAKVLIVDVEELAAVVERLRADSERLESLFIALGEPGWLSDPMVLAVVTALQDYRDPREAIDAARREATK